MEGEMEKANFLGFIEKQNFSDNQIRRISKELFQHRYNPEEPNIPGSIFISICEEIFYNLDNLPLNVYLYGSSDLYKEWRDGVDWFPIGFSDVFGKYASLHRLRKKNIAKIKEGDMCFVDVDHIELSRYKEIMKICKEKHVLLATLAYKYPKLKQEAQRFAHNRAMEALYHNKHEDLLPLILGEDGDEYITPTHNVKLKSLTLQLAYYYLEYITHVNFISPENREKSMKVANEMMEQIKRKIK